MTSVVDRGICSNLMYLAALNLASMYALRLPILFRVRASYTTLSLIEFWNLHHRVIFFSQDIIVSHSIRHTYLLRVEVIDP